MTKRDRRVVKSQEAIKKAILELMTEKNFEDITIRDISDRANVNRVSRALPRCIRNELPGRELRLV